MQRVTLLMRNLKVKNQRPLQNKILEPVMKTWVMASWLKLSCHNVAVSLRAGFTRRVRSWVSSKLIFSINGTTD